jgi:hypothetical protein
MYVQPDDTVIALVVSLSRAADGTWALAVDGANGQALLSLAPATFIVRLRQNNSSGLIRGTIHLHGSAIVAPVQTNQQIEALLRAWLQPAGR